MTRKEKVNIPVLGMKVFHESIYNGHEQMKIVGIREKEVELEGDFSGGTNRVVQQSWLDKEGVFRLRQVCKHKDSAGSCPLHNLHCSFPTCEPFLSSDHHYENGERIGH
jgi:hypothetical protein